MGVRAGYPTAGLRPIATVLQRRSYSVHMAFKDSLSHTLRLHCVATLIYTNFLPKHLTLLRVASAQKLASTCSNPSCETKLATNCRCTFFRHATTRTSSHPKAGPPKLKTSSPSTNSSRSSSPTIAASTYSKPSSSQCSCGPESGSTLCSTTVPSSTPC